MEGYKLFWTSAIVGFLTFGTLLAMGFLRRKNEFPIEGRTAIITGGSTGLGRGLGKVFAQKGGSVIIVARDVKKLKAAVEYISGFAKNPSLQRFHYISADLTSAAENDRVIAEATTWNDGLPPDIVWANAGSSLPCLFADLSPEELRAQMDVNYFSVAFLSRSALRAWIEPLKTEPGVPSEPVQSIAGKPAPALGPRHLVMTSSSAALYGIAGYGAYQPPKAAIRGLSDCLRQEVNIYNGARRRKAAPSGAKDGVPDIRPPADIRVSSVYPGTILTPGLETENLTKHPVTEMLEKDDPQQTEDQVAHAAVRGLEAGHYMVTTQWLASLMRISALAGSPRNGWWILDTVGSWVTSVAWLVLGPTFDGQVYGWAKKNGVYEKGKGRVGPQSS